MSSNGRPRNRDAGNGVRFVVVDHPDKLKNKDELRKNRQHVMLDYLERTRPSSDESCVDGVEQGRKRKRNGSSVGHSSNPSAPGNIFRAHSARVSIPSPEDSNPSPELSPDLHGSLEVAQMARPAYGRLSIAGALPASTRQRTSVPSIDAGPLVAGMSGRHANNSYHDTQADTVPFMICRFGSSLNPFDTWPTFSEPSINIKKLKLSCSQRFGSKAMAVEWVPTLLTARHAFLSTLCLSSAHEDIMCRSYDPAQPRPRRESFERICIHNEVLGMIKESVNNPATQTTDATLVALLTLLNAEIMGCDYNLMQLHVKGLHALIVQRGGLEALGLNGQLAARTTVTMYMIAALQETMPHPDFMQFASKQDTRPPTDSRRLPESPLYRRATGYTTITKCVTPYSSMFKLLEDCARLTQACITPDTTSKESLFATANDVFAYQPGADLEFRDMRERYTYEAIRLTARLYSHAVANRLSFSVAALSIDMPPAVHIQIRDALMKTDLADCWGHMSGVLFWIALVAGAAANQINTPADGAFVQEDDGSGARGEAKEARMWLAAILVRCSIVLGFEYGPSILETVKTMLAVQHELKRTNDADEARWEGRAESVAERSHGSVGSSVSPVSSRVQLGFVDFARDFPSS